VVSKAQVRGTILVADDHEPNRELFRELLTAEGFDVVTVPDGAAALEEFARIQPSLVLLDVMMPKLTGFEVCRKLKNDPHTCLTPIIMVTGLSAKEDRLEGIEAGADEFLTRPVDRFELSARVRSLVKIKAHTDELERAEFVLFALARSIEAKDTYTQDHCDRLAQYATRLGEHLGFSREEIVALNRAGIVHDIGKVAIPDALLLKRGPLNQEEWKLMKEHPIVGERICSPLKSFRLVLPIIRHHHEKRDGSGYPDGLRGEQIPATARVLQIVDVYDALTTERPYKQALSPAEALGIMQEEVQRGWWDPDFFAKFRPMVMADLWGTGAKGAAAGH
jgi:putative two-component system response regulator